LPELPEVEAARRVIERVAVGRRIVEVRCADDDSSVVEGVIETFKVKELEKLQCVDYVRTTFSWIADYPPGDPRDKDKCHREVDE